MSDYYIEFVPANPQFVPEGLAVEDALKFLRGALQDKRHQGVSFKIYDRVMFFDPGDNWEGVHCAQCGAEVEHWWVDAICRSDKTSHSRDLMARTPCCNRETSLNDMNFGSVGGAFGLFVLRIENPDFPDIEAEIGSALERILGTRLRKVLNHV
jgi:hypothetical protein